MTVTAGAAGTSLDRRAFTILAGIAFVTLMVLARDMTFRWDEWDLIAARSLDDLIGLLRPYNEQWITVPATIFRALFAAFGMHSYLPYLAVLLTVHLLAAAQVGRLVAQLSGTVSGLAAAGAMLFLGSGNEVLGQFIGIGLILPVMLGFWAIHALAIGGRPGRAALLVTLSLASHPLGAAFLGACVVIAAGRDRYAIAWLVVPLMVVVTWFVAFDLPTMTGRGATLAAGVASIPAFVMSGAAATAGGIFGLSSTGGVLLLAGVAFAAWRIARRPVHGLLAAAALVGLAIEFALVAISRSEFGAGAATWSRYLYVAVPFLLVAGAAWFGRLPSLRADRRREAEVALAALTAVAIIGNLRVYVSGRDLTLEAVHATRAAVAIAEWAPDLHSWDQELHLPGPDTVRDLIRAHGSPARDDIVPWVVPPVPRTIAEATCRQLVPDPGRQVDCVTAVRRLVGRSQP